MSRREEREARVCKAVRELVTSSDAQTALIKNRWRENYDMFVYGSQNTEKESWQTNFSVNKLQTSTRTMQGRLVNALVNTPDWFSLDPRSCYNKDAEMLAPTFSKLMDYFITASGFKKHAGTFFLCSLIGTGNLHIGWRQKLIQNPEYILEKTEKQRQEIQRRLAKNVVNPDVPADDALQGENLEKNLLDAIDEFAAEAQGKEITKEKTPPYIQIGGLDLMDINHEKIYWDPNVMYMEDSMWRAFEYEVNKYELNYFAKLGFFSKAAVKRIGSQKDVYTRSANARLRYQNTVQSPKGKSDLVKLTVYYGPLIENEEIVEDRYFAIIANENILLKDGEYPFWEPPGHNTPIITAAVRQVPYRATGAGIGDNAVTLQKIYDSNWQLVCDTFRFGISGINVVNYQNLVDKSQLDEGVYPGMTLSVRGTPKESFERVSLTDNLENQAHPVQTMLEGAIDQLTGVNDLMVGGGNPYSRTPAAETNARLDAGQQNVNIIALDLEQNFIIPALEKIFARVLQFGVGEITKNPDLAAMLDDEEKNQLAQLNAKDRLTILNQWYDFKIKGFSGAQDKNAQAQRDNELLQIINSGGILGQLINLPEFMKRYFENRDIRDPEQLLLVNNSPLQQTTSENQLLLSRHAVLPLETDDHNFHIQQHGPLAQSPFATPELQQHMQAHMMMAQAQQMQNQPPSGPVQ